MTDNTDRSFLINSLFLLGIALVLYGTYAGLGIWAVCIVGGCMAFFFSVCLQVVNDAKPKQTKIEKDFAKLKPRDQEALRSLGMGPDSKLTVKDELMKKAGEGSITEETTRTYRRGPRGPSDCAGL